MNSLLDKLPDRNSLAFQGAAVAALPFWFPFWGACVKAQPVSDQGKEAVRRVVRQHFSQVPKLWKGMSYYASSLPLYGLIHHVRSKVLLQLETDQQSSAKQALTLLMVDGVVGASAACVGAPVTVAVSLKQKQNLKLRASLAWLRKEASLSALFRGIGPLTVSNAAFSITMMSGSELLRRRFEHQGLDRTPSTLLASVLLAPAGCAASLPARLLANVLIDDVQRQRYRGSLHAMQVIWRAQGVQGFFRCFTLRNAAFTIQLMAVNLLMPPVKQLLERIALPEAASLAERRKAVTDYS